MPVDCFPVARSSPETEDEYHEAEETDSTVLSSVVLAFLADKRAD